MPTHSCIMQADPQLQRLSAPRSSPLVPMGAEVSHKLVWMALRPGAATSQLPAFRTKQAVTSLAFNTVCSRNAELKNLKHRVEEPEAVQAKQEKQEFEDTNEI